MTGSTATFLLALFLIAPPTAPVTTRGVKWNGLRPSPVPVPVGPVPVPAVAPPVTPAPAPVPAPYPTVLSPVTYWKSEDKDEVEVELEAEVDVEAEFEDEVEGDDDDDNETSINDNYDSTPLLRFNLFSYQLANISEKHESIALAVYGTVLWSTFTVLYCTPHPDTPFVTNML